MSSINQNKLRVKTMQLGKNDMNGTSMEALRSTITARISVGVSLFFFTFVFYLSPVGMLVAQEVNNTSAPIVLTGTPEQKMNQGLLKVQEIAVKKHAKISQRLADEGSFLDNALELIGLGQLTLEDVNELQQLSSLLAEQHTQAIANFNQTKAKLIAKNLPEIILQRHNDAVVKYQASYDDMQQKLQSVLQAGSLQAQQEASAALDNLMKGHKLKKTHQKTDPNNLPFGTPDASKTRKPAKTAEQLSSLTGISNHQQPILLAANVITPGMLGQPGGPVAEDLAETPDIKFTDAIKAKALELEDDPVKIYNWVRNNIEFIPSYGSIQGADYTLEHGKGNAFDTASLLIALYRAANIPARYAYGTVEIPVEKVMNWVGGVDVPEAAQQLLGQGGIPNVALVNGGKITHIRMETVWAEAWVDYFPSHAAKHVVGDQWIPLDASFKQYNYINGMDFSSAAGSDVELLVSDIVAEATYDETTGSIQGIPTNKIDSFVTNYTDQLGGYIDSQGSGLTLEQVLGAKRTIIFEHMSLASGLPYKLVTRTKNFNNIPDDLRHKIRFTLQSEAGGGYSGYSTFSDVLAFNFSLPELAGKTMSLSYKPATDADNQVFSDLIPEGGITNTNIPTSIPGYLISVSAELNIDKQTLITAGSIPLGTETNHRMEIYTPSTGWSSTNATGIAGEYRAIGIDPGGISPVQLTGIQQESEMLLQKIEVDNLTGLNKHHFTGLMMQTNILSYFAMNNVMSYFQSQAASVVEYRLPSYGYFMTTLTPSYNFGIPVSVQTSGVTMDVPFLRTMSTAKDNNLGKWVQYNKSTGLRASYLENWIPEFTLSTQDQQLEGVSATKLLALAQKQGQKVYTITSANSSQLANIQIDSRARQDIENSLRAGKVVTVHESPINVNGWSGSGYLIIDPETGAGGYLISGGASGGSISDILLGFSGWLLGMIDGAYGHLAGSAWFSNTLKYAQRMLDLSKKVGFFGLAAGIGIIFYNQGITWNSIGAAAVGLLAFALTMASVTAIAAGTGVIAGAILGGIAAATIGYLGVLLTRALF